MGRGAKTSWQQPRNLFCDVVLVSASHDRAVALLHRKTAGLVSIPGYPATKGHQPFGQDQVSQLVHHALLQSARIRAKNSARLSPLSKVETVTGGPAPLIFM